LIVDGDEYPYNILFDRNPLLSKAAIVHSVPPKCFPDDGKKADCTFTSDEMRVVISWESNGRKILIRSALTSEH